MKIYIKSSEDEYEEYDPFNGHTYRVSCGYDTKFAETPRSALRYWFKGQQNNPGDCMIMSKTRDDAIKLVKAATEDVLTTLYDQYECPYKLEYLIEESKKKVQDGCKGFYENDYGYGDTIHPFGVG